MWTCPRADTLICGGITLPTATAPRATPALTIPWVCPTATPASSVLTLVGMTAAGNSMIPTGKQKQPTARPWEVGRATFRARGGIDSNQTLALLSGRRNWTGLPGAGQSWSTATRQMVLHQISPFPQDPTPALPLAPTPTVMFPAGLPEQPSRTLHPRERRRFPPMARLPLLLILSAMPAL